MLGKRVVRGRFHSHAFLVSIGGRRKGTGGRKGGREEERAKGGGGRGLSDGGFAPRPLAGQISGGWKALKVIVVMNWQQVN